MARLETTDAPTSDQGTQSDLTHDPTTEDATTADPSSAQAGARYPDASHEPIANRLGRGAIAGVIVGLIFLGLHTWYAASTGGAATDPLGLISSIVLGAEALPEAANPALGFVIHLGMSAIFGMVFAIFAPLFRNNGAIALAGGLYGVALFAVNYLFLASTILPQFQDANLPVELMAHVVFGHLLALGFYSSGSRAHLKRFPIARGAGLRGP